MHWLLGVSHPSFSSLCPLSPPHASFSPTPSCCPSDLLFRPSVCLWLLVFIFKQHTVFISVNLLTIFAFKYLVSKMFQSCWCCNVLCHDMSIFLITYSNSHNNDNTVGFKCLWKKCHSDFPTPKLGISSCIKISKSNRPQFVRKKCLF